MAFCLEGFVGKMSLPRPVINLGSCHIFSCQKSTLLDVLKDGQSHFSPRLPVHVTYYYRNADSVQFDEDMLEKLASLRCCTEKCFGVIDDVVAEHQDHVSIFDNIFPTVPVLYEYVCNHRTTMVIWSMDIEKIESYLGLVDRFNMQSRKQIKVYWSRDLFVK